MSEESSNDGLTADQAVQLHKGAAVIDPPYRLTYNEDREGYYYLRYEGEVHEWSFSFTRVERAGKDVFNLADERRGAFYLKNIDNFEALRKALVTLSRNTPDKPPKDRE